VWQKRGVWLGGCFGGGGGGAPGRRGGAGSERKKKKKKNRGGGAGGDKVSGDFFFAGGGAKRGGHPGRRGIFRREERGKTPWGFRNGGGGGGDELGERGAGTKKPIKSFKIRRPHKPGFCDFFLQFNFLGPRIFFSTLHLEKKTDLWKGGGRSSPGTRVLLPKRGGMFRGGPQKVRADFLKKWKAAGGAPPIFFLRREKTNL